VVLPAEGVDAESLVGIVRDFALFLDLEQGGEEALYSHVIKLLQTQTVVGFWGLESMFEG